MKLEDVESARRKYYIGIIIKRSYFITNTIIIVAYLGITGGSISYQAFCLFLFFGIFMPVYFYDLVNGLAKAYCTTYKSYFVGQNLSAVFSNLSYQHNAGISKKMLNQTRAFYAGRKYKSNDFTSGTYKDVGFFQADVKAKEMHIDIGGRKTYSASFEGRFMIFEFPKKFNFKLELVGRNIPIHIDKYYPKESSVNRNAERISAESIKEDESFQIFLEEKLKKVRKSTAERRTELISTESAEFNESFFIFAEDGLEAFSLLDPAMIVRIQKLADAHKRKIVLVFVDNVLVIGINNKNDSFEPPKPSRPINEEEENKRISSDIRITTDLIDTLSLDHKLFSK